MGDTNIENQGITGQTGYVGGTIGTTPNTQGQTEQAGYVGGTIGTIPNTQGQTGYIGGIVDNQGTTHQAGYVGGIIGNTNTNEQNIGYGTNVTGQGKNPQNLPAKQGFWSKLKSLFTTKSGQKTELRLDIPEKGEKVLTEVHDFLFQDISFKGFMDILKIGKDKK